VSNTQEIICYLDSKRKWRNKNEYRDIPRVSCPEFDLEIVGDGAIVKRMAKALHENNCDISRVFSVYRGDTLVFKKTTLKQWLFSEDRRPEWLKPKGESSER